MAQAPLPTELTPGQDRFKVPGVIEVSERGGVARGRASGAWSMHRAELAVTKGVGGAWLWAGLAVRDTARGGLLTV